jgi:hypothetical protein
MVKFLSHIHGIGKFLYSLEDIDIENALARKYIRHTKPTVILIIRDPYNWLASTIKRQDTSLDQLYVKKNILIKYMNQALNIRDYVGSPVVTINYNKWATEKGYRNDICQRLDIPFSETADKTLMQVPDFGGGSSFTRTAPMRDKNRSDIFNRWQEFTTNRDYLELLNDEHLIELSEQLFQISKPF